MTHLLPAEAPRRIGGDGFWRKTWAVLVKEFIQLKRDRVSFAMIIMIPLIQLMLFGYAINTNPRHLPTAVLLQEHSDLGRSILAAIKNTDYFNVTQRPSSEAEMDELLAAGKILFGIEIPHGFERARAPRRLSGDAGRGGRHRSDCRKLGGRRPQSSDADRAGARSRHSGRPRAAVRNPHPPALQPGRAHPAQYRAGAGRHHPHHDHADLHGAVGDARDRARYHGKSACRCRSRRSRSCSARSSPTSWSASSRRR